VHFLRGLENTWMDIYDEPEKLGALIDLLADMDIALIEKYAENGVDAIFMCDDWGLQDRLMIRPESWYELWQPRYARVFGAAHARGLKAFLHSCGYILDILPGLIDAGLDVIQMDQQMNMGLDKLSRFRGRLTFFCPVDIQAVMPRNDLKEIRRYCHRLAEAFAAREGGFIADWYADPAAVGHSREAVDAMCDEFGRISRELYGQ
jgi:uroporphyrinogen decarboxylase